MLLQRDPGDTATLRPKQKIGLEKPCERSFSDYDSYAARLFLNRFNEFEEVRDSNRRLTGYVRIADTKLSPTQRRWRSDTALKLPCRIGRQGWFAASAAADASIWW
jgi:hypothetical protein